MSQAISERDGGAAPIAFKSSLKFNNLVRNDTWLVCRALVKSHFCNHKAVEQFTSLRQQCSVAAELHNEFCFTSFIKLACVQFSHNTWESRCNSSCLWYADYFHGRFFRSRTHYIN